MRIRSVSTCRTDRGWGFRNAYVILAGKHQGSRLFKRLRSILQDNIKMDLSRTGFEVVVQDGEPRGSKRGGDFLTGCMNTGRTLDLWIKSVR
jgi:hypothetical protein